MKTLTIKTGEGTTLLRRMAGWQTQPLRKMTGEGKTHRNRWGTQIMIILAFIALHVVAYGADKYIKVGGNNANSGNDWANAWAHPNYTNGVVTYGTNIIIGPGRYDTVAVIPTVGGLTFKCAELYDDADSGRVSTILSSGIDLSGDFTLRTGSVYRYDVTVGPRWNTMVADGRMAVTEDDSVLMSCTSLAAVDAAGKYFYDASTDSLFVRCFASDDPDGHTMRFSQRPVVELKNATNNITFYGLTLDMGYQATVILTYSESATSAADSITIYGCIVQNTSGYGGGVNPALIYSGNTTGGTPSNEDEWSQRNLFRNLILRHSKANSSDYSGGAAFDFYAVQKSRIDSCTIWDCYGGPFMLKYGSSGAEQADSLTIADNFCVGGRASLWSSGRIKNLLVTRNYLLSATTYAIDIHSTSANGPYESINILNNTIWNGGSGANIVIAPEAAGSCNIKYNMLFDSTTQASSTILFDIQSGEAPEQHPLTCTYYTIDYNLYYFGSGSFVAGNDYTTPSAGDSACSYLGSSFANHQANGFDVHSSVSNPKFLQSQTATVSGLSRPNSSAEMNVTYDGRNHTLFGAWQPTESGSESTLKVKVKVR